MLFISFHTGGKYAAMAQRLANSLARFQLPHVIERIDDNGGGWQANCKRKPLYILNALLKHRDAIIWLDADTHVERFPALLIGGHDFAAFNWHAEQQNPLGFAYQPERLAVSGGVLRFGYTAPAMELLIRWQSAIEQQLGLDDPCLDHAFNTATPPLNALWLPPAYNRMNAFAGVEPVIAHDNADGAHANGTENGNTAD